MARRLLLCLTLGAVVSGCGAVGNAEVLLGALRNAPAATPSSTPHPSATPPPSTGHVTPPPTRPPPEPGPLARAVYRGSSATKTIAITIDDGGDPQVCLDMAHTLLRMDATATFFPIGRAVAANPGVWRWIGSKFPLGNHTENHPLLTHLSPAAIRAEIAQAGRTMRAATGRPPIPYLRPPGGAWNESVARVARSLGYRTLVLWDTTDADTALHSRVTGMLRDALRGGSGSILLMHCNRQLSEQILPRVIDAYRSRGFRFVTIPRLLAGR